MNKVVNLYKEKYDVYIGRQGKGKDGYFGSPIKMGYKCPICNKKHTDRGSTLDCYKIYFFNRLKNDLIFKTKIESLKGHILGCFCKPQPCHGDIIVEYLDKYEKNNNH